MRIKSLLFIFCSIFMFSQNRINALEHTALIEMFNALDGKNWHIPWDLSQDPAHWYGVTIENESVTKLQLSANHLKGDLPHLLSQFPNLKVLDLSSNNLSGTIPSSLASLSHLEVLDLSHNRLEGTVEFLASFTAVRELYLGYNQLSIQDIEGSLQGMNHLQRLDIAFCNLDKVPNSLVKFSELEYLDLSGNKITSGFDHLGKLSSLRELLLSNQELEKIPSSVSSLVQLKSLNLSYNKIKDFSPLTKLSILEWLSLENNGLEAVPAEVGALSQLVHINLNHNEISDISTLAQLINLEQIFANKNRLEGNFPESLLSLKKLQTLSLMGNNLSGKLPSELPYITMLQNNRFTLQELESAFSSLQNKVLEYSPQRYDSETYIKAEVGQPAELKQSFSMAEGYTFTWLKNMEEDMRSYFESHRFDKVKDEDFTSYTCEAYYIKKNNDTYFEVSFFREPIILENKSLGTDNPLRYLKVYPNPVRDILNIDTENIRLIKTIIYDMSGKKLMESREQHISVKHLPSSSYIVIVETDLGTKSFKVLKH